MFAVVVASNATITASESLHISAAQKQTTANIAASQAGTMNITHIVRHRRNFVSCLYLNFLCSLSDMLSVSAVVRFDCSIAPSPILRKSLPVVLILHRYHSLEVIVYIVVGYRISPPKTFFGYREVPWGTLLV